MKNWKKLVSLLVTLCMIVSLAVPAFAVGEEGDDSTTEVTEVAEEKTGDTDGTGEGEDGDAGGGEDVSTGDDENITDNGDGEEAEQPEQPEETVETEPTHSWNDGEVTKEATCTEAGEVTYTCTDEGCNETKTKEIPAAGHTYVNGTCTVCGAKDPDYVPPYCYVQAYSFRMPFTSFLVTAVGETGTYEQYIYWNYDTEVDGYPVYNRIAGLYIPEGTYTFIWKGVDGEGKNWEGKTKAEVINTYEDPNYWDIYVSFIPQYFKEVHVHSYIETISKEATCTEAGEKTFTCGCGDSYSEEIPALGHSFGEDGKCTNPGCDEVYVCVARIGDATYETLQAAIDAAQSGNTIVLLADCEGAIIDNQALTSLTIDLGGHTVTAAHGQWKEGKCITVSNNTNMKLESLTVCNGTIADANGTTGGGISCVYAKSISVTVKKVTFQNNSASQGAAIAFSISNGAVTALIEECSFYNNVGTGTAAVSSFANEQHTNSITIRNCVFEGNKAKDGGAVYGDDSIITISGSSFTGNEATDGGAVYAYNTSSVTISDSTITGNTATAFGGGIYAEGGTLDIMEGTQVCNNSATLGGDDIYSAEGNSITLPDAAAMGATLTNHAITGWYKDYEPRWGTAYTKVNPGEYTAELLLKAAYTPAPTTHTVTLSYNANGGEGAPESESQRVTRSATFTVSSAAPTREGYEFVCWTLNGAEYHGGDTITLSASATLVAKWREVEEQEEEDLEDEDTPLGELPDRPDAEPPKEEEEDLEDEDVPLAAVPQTGDPMLIYLALGAGAGMGLAWMGLRKKDEEA